MPRSNKERFWVKVDKTGGPDSCWPWTAARHYKGYGQFTWRVSYGVFEERSAHRTAWELAHGPVLDGLHVLHRCDNPPCCNPAHLWLGTNAENNADMMRKGRHVVPLGEAHGRSKLTRDGVALLHLLGLSIPKAAKLFGVSGTTIWAVRHGKVWGSVDRCELPRAIALGALL